MLNISDFAVISSKYLVYVPGSVCLYIYHLNSSSNSFYDVSINSVTIIR
jgi:hypothetical protein